mmetsp:Transcript_26688/g.72094  ORF Transcript_26688/g.72094 Transcript_26688/m.72094 type:complete len:272 (-) Transcript_26688:980-1795(-)
MILPAHPANVVVVKHEVKDLALWWHGHLEAHGAVLCCLSVFGLGVIYSARTHLAHKDVEKGACLLGQGCLKSPHHRIQGGGLDASVCWLALHAMVHLLAHHGQEGVHDAEHRSQHTRRLLTREWGVWLQGVCVSLGQLSKQHVHRDLQLVCVLRERGRQLCTPCTDHVVPQFVVGSSHVHHAAAAHSGGRCSGNAVHLHDQVDTLSQRQCFSAAQTQRAVVIQHRVERLHPHMVHRAIQDHPGPVGLVIAVHIAQGFGQHTILPGLGGCVV